MVGFFLLSIDCPSRLRPPPLHGPTLYYIRLVRLIARREQHIARRCRRRCQESYSPSCNTIKPLLLLLPPLLSSSSYYTVHKEKDERRRRRKRKEKKSTEYNSKRRELVTLVHNLITIWIPPSLKLISIVLWAFFKKM